MSPKPSMKFGSKNAIRDELTRNLIFVAFFACMGSVSHEGNCLVDSIIVRKLTINS